MIVLWLCGLSGAGKSTIADALVSAPAAAQFACVRLDGDDLREGLNRDLGFSAEDRSENLRRAAHVAKILCKAGHSVVCSFITPLAEDRKVVAEILGEKYVEVYVQASLEACEKRDPKGLYVKARNGQIRDFTGIGSPYEPPADAQVVIDSENTPVEEAVRILLSEIAKRSPRP
jgi:adenylylsulfate kinase